MCEKEKNGAWIRLDDKRGEGDIDIFTSNNNSFIEGVAWKVP
jgi:hypothetical protein